MNYKFGVFGALGGLFGGWIKRKDIDQWQADVLTHAGRLIGSTIQQTGIPQS